MADIPKEITDLVEIAEPVKLPEAKLDKKETSLKPVEEKKEEVQSATLSNSSSDKNNSEMYQSINSNKSGSTRRKKKWPTKENKEKQL